MATASEETAEIGGSREVCSSWWKMCVAGQGEEIDLKEEGEWSEGDYKEVRKL